ncbi:MAG: hypothetical protein AB8B74_13995 [Crocinitomicaceae bacterium]
MGKKIGNFNLVNYKDHPTNPIYKVLNFNSQDEADLFEKKLISGNHFYEKDIELHQGEQLFLFAVKNRSFEQVQQLNFEVHAAFRKPMIKNKVARYILVIFFLATISFALIGYFKTQAN